MLVLGVAGIFILIIIYLYVRTEGLRRELYAARRQLSNVNSDIKAMEEVTESLAFEQQLALRKGVSRLQSFGHPDTKVLKFTAAMVEALVNVTVDAAKGHKNVVEAFRKQLGRTTDISFEDFNTFISEQDERIKMEWHKKTVLGYLAVCRLMVDVLNGVSVEEGGSQG